MPETYAFERSKDMRKKKVTSSDIAHAAGVSQATVSMILNKKYNVSFSKETIRKTDRRILFQPHEPLLCYVASGD